MNRTVILLSVTSVLSILLFSAVLSPVAASNSVAIFPAGDKPYGLTYVDHIKNFWRWAIKIPANDNPVNDPTGAKCAVGQENSNSPVFYLSFNNGGTSNRTCKVPAGKGLFIPVMQEEVSDKEKPNGNLDLAAKHDQDIVNSLYLKIGDKEYNFQDLNKYRVHTDTFDVVFPDNGIFGVSKGGVSKAVADGRYVITQPLVKGTYTIHYKASNLDPENPSTSFAQDITYTIIAE